MLDLHPKISEHWTHLALGQSTSQWKRKREKLQMLSRPQKTVKEKQLSFRNDFLGEDLSVFFWKKTSIYKVFFVAFFGNKIAHLISAASDLPSTMQNQWEKLVHDMKVVIRKRRRSSR